VFINQVLTILLILGWMDSFGFPFALGGSVKSQSFNFDSSLCLLIQKIAFMASQFSRICISVKSIMISWLWCHSTLLDELLMKNKGEREGKMKKWSEKEGGGCEKKN